MNISFIGFGNMAKAIAKGLVNNHEYTIRAAAPSLSIGVTEDGIETHSDNRAILAQADIVIIAVKPKQMSDVFAEIKSFIPSSALLISVAASIGLEWFDKHEGASLAIVRAMPNIAASIKASATPLLANNKVNEKQRQWAETIFSSIGIITWVEKESDIAAFTALSGSGPAYVFYFIESLVNAAVSLGLEKKIATQFALQMVSGAVNLATISQTDLSGLRRNVTSPGGTTAAAMEVLMNKHWGEIIHQAMEAAHHRAEASDTKLDEL